MCGSLFLTLYGNKAKQKEIWTSFVVFHCIFQSLGVSLSVKCEQVNK